MPIALVYVVAQPVITEHEKSTFYRIGDPSPANVPGFYVFCTEPVPTSGEILQYMLNSSQLRNFVGDGYKEINKKERGTIKKIVIPYKSSRKKNVVLEKTETVRLGGTFEKIGDEDENVGGRNQKVGSDNK